MSDLVIKDPRYFVKLRAVQGYEGPWDEAEKYLKDQWIQVASIRSFMDAFILGWTELITEGNQWDHVLYVKAFPQEVAEMIRKAVSP